MNAPLHIAPVGVVVIILLILALARHPAEATAVPCSQTGTLAPLNLTNGDSILIIEGLGVTVFPVDKGVPQYSSFINLIFEGVQEFWCVKTAELYLRSTSRVWLFLRRQAPHYHL